MATTKKNAGTMILPSVTAAALWLHMVMPQIGDGVWENATPHGHYKAWSELDVGVITNATPHVEGGGYFTKKNYNLRRLVSKDLDLSIEMIALGRMALACRLVGLDWTCYSRGRSTADCMPATYEEWVDRKANRRWDVSADVNGHIALDMESVTDELARMFYAQEWYGLKQVKTDLDTIKAAMLTVN